MATMNQVGVGLSGASGTGSFAGTTSASLTTPSIDVINDTNGNEAISISATPSATNYFNFLNAGVLSGVAIQAVGAGTNIGMTLNTKGTGQFVLSTEALTQPFAIVSGTSSQKLTNFAFANTAGSNVVTFPDSSGTVAFTSSAVTQIKTFRYTGNATYTPTSGTKFVLIEMCGSGGGGGGSANGTVGSSGGAGGYILQLLTAAEVGASLAIVVPAGGAGGGTNAAGTAGGNVTVTTPSSAIVLTANGGAGGFGGSSSGSGIVGGNVGGTASVSTGSVTYTGLYIQGGGSAAAFTITDVCVASLPGVNPLSCTGAGQAAGGFTTLDARGYGGGGGGAVSNSVGGNRSGATGVTGVVFITEYS